MSGSDLGIKFEVIGIADALARHKLVVPLNQRSYAWEQSHVNRLLEDFSAQMNKSDRMYFLGTIVLSHEADSDDLLVSDGQQRLATTSILIAAIRDYLAESDAEGAKKTAEKYTHKFLMDYDEEHDEEIPKLRLNADDRDYFTTAIIAPPSPLRSSTHPKAIESHTRLKAAADLAKKHVAATVVNLPINERAKWLYQWVKFLESSAVVIAITVPEEIDAYRMFETLNDRGLRASQIDILKNHLFQESRDRLKSEVQPRWSAMVGTIEAIGDEELLLNYVRHFWITRHGPTTEDDLAKSFKEKISGRKQATEIVASLDQQSSDYVALLTPLENPQLMNFGKEARAYLAAITTLLKVGQIRPLLLAILQKFEINEAKKAFELCLSWSVRFLVAGGGGGGVLDKNYGQCAREVTIGAIRTAKQLGQKMADYIPSDNVFEQAFRIHQVGKIALARYYLHSIENFKRGESKPQIGYFEMPETSTNLEHIMPSEPNDNWPDVEQDYYRRIGNLTLLTAKTNARLGDASFLEKKKAYRASTFLITQEIGEYREWDMSQIQKRQNKLAELAPKVWPI